MQQEPAAGDRDGTAGAPAPRVHTLLLTDLCDSVALVERLGDTAAAELFQEHDRLVLRLQQHWKGRMIDRSDGLLLLFDRPVSGLGFALDYRQGLEELARARGIELQARTGMHVGEVLTWHNSAEAVQAGAKPLEVEGLAKPLAARLMALARPGQILLSAVAESLARRSARELGGRSEHLLWKSHGRWHFKGVPVAQEVFEVGEPGFAPLRMPRSTPKAWRDLPLWRRPAALVAEAALVVALAVVTWGLIRPEPAIAFGERDWIVVGDFANGTADPGLGEALQQALRISLEQSRYVNVLSDMKVRETLQQMQRDPTRSMDQQTALELATRVGARALIMPSVREMYGKLRVSLDVLDPSTGKTVYSEHADGRGLDSSLASIDKVTTSLRRNLGEALAEITQHSAPLPKVATSSLDALHAYAVGADAYLDSRHDDAMGHFEQATRLDPDFAAAYIGQMRIAFARGNFDRARELLALAMSRRDHLSARDSLYLDSWAAELDGSGPAETAHRWKLLGDLYPDFYAAHHNRSGALFTLGLYKEAERAVRLALAPQNPMRMLSVRQLARTELAQNKNGEALASFQQVSVGGTPDRELAAAMAAMGDFDGAWHILDAIPEDAVPAWLERIAVAVDQGDVRQALRNAERARVLCKVDASVCSTFDLQVLALRLETGSAPDGAEFEEWLRYFHQQATREQSAEKNDWAFMAATALYLAQRSGHARLVATWLPRLSAMAGQIGERRVQQMVSLVEARAEADDGAAAERLAHLRAQIDGTELIQVHAQLLALYERSGDERAAQRERAWLAVQRGLAYSENAGTYSLIALNVADVRRARELPAP